jgi:hypothetical protein
VVLGMTVNCLANGVDSGSFRKLLGPHVRLRLVETGSPSILGDRGGSQEAAILRSQSPKGSAEWRFGLRQLLGAGGEQRRVRRGGSVKRVQRWRLRTASRSRTERPAGLPVRSKGTS